jgi:pre-mRNA-splicing factor 38A
MIIFSLSYLAATVLDKAVDLQGIGGSYANHKPTEFLCLTLKLLQLQPEKEIVIEYIRNEDFKFVSFLFDDICREQCLTHL